MAYNLSVQKFSVEEKVRNESEILVLVHVRGNVQSVDNGIREREPAKAKRTLHYGG